MKRILIIEDDNTLRETICEILDNESFEVYEACNGNQGMQLQQEMLFDMVITDILMPDKDGIEVIIELKTSFPKTKIIAMSGGGNVLAKDYLQIANHLGCDDSIVKPFDINELIRKVNAVFIESTC